MSALFELFDLRPPLPDLQSPPALLSELPVLSAQRSPLLPRSHSRKPAQTRPVAQSTALRLQLAAQLSSELPLLQSEEELTARAKGQGPRKQRPVEQPQPHLPFRSLPIPPPFVT